MNKVISLFQLRMMPAGVNFALLLLRLGLGLAMLMLHGWGKLTGFSGMSASFPDPWGLGSSVTLGLLVFAEVVCAALLAIGLFTRFAALVLTIGMLCAFWYGHGARLTGEANGEVAFLFLVGFLAIFFAGPGRYAIDSRLGASSLRTATA